MEFKGENGEFFLLETITAKTISVIEEDKESYLSIIWNRDKDTSICIDTIEYVLKKNEILFVTELNKVNFNKIEEVNVIRFNRSFYCLDNHDSEIGCKGILFFNTSKVPIISLQQENRLEIENLWKVFTVEMLKSDELQGEMLQMLLKRFLILATRIYRCQNKSVTLDETKLELIRDFNFLVEVYFKKKHSVAEYADLMNKPAKSLTNFFSFHTTRTPLQVIQDRILLEAKRMLLNTEIPIKEITFELGFEDMPSFSRFFKNKIGISPKAYRDIKTMV
ncbi:AraC family transcriptional regulator [Flavobacterium sp. 9AF]|uniref:helix-turn-helix domain-containing protein n=1 Tax=Flavobacterium sp. 9AF TaxID=2653142 RepID=UPI0012F32C03|nr:helix-turn-helix transcriptional regulator [Flavobacterium sp. 9AF]VXA93094.1 AraC family transcriptional regulator [Flavobacterium sp. 9AF]